jgi:hypothetical protein
MTQTSQAAQETNSSFKEGAQGIASTAGVVGSLTASTYGLHDAYLQQQDANLRLTDAENNLSKAHQTVQNAELSLQNAQTHLNLLIAEGITSGPQYTTAQNAVTKAQDSLTNANLQLTNAQNNVTAAQNRSQMAGEAVNQQWLMMATSTLPMLLTQLPAIIAFTTGYGAAEDALTASQLAQAAGSKIASAATWLWDAAMDANPIGLVVIAIMGLVTLIGIATDGFKNWTPLIKDVNIAFQDLYTAGKDVFGFFEVIFEDEIKGWMAALDDFWNLIKPMVEGVEALGSDISRLFGGGSSSAASSGGSSTYNINVSQNNQISSGYDASNAHTELANTIAQGLQTGY